MTDVTPQPNPHPSPSMSKGPVGLLYGQLVSAKDEAENAGTNYHIQGLANNGTGGTEWTARQWGDQGAYYLDAQGSHPSTCGAADYKSTEINSGEILKFWDARNNT
jgi:hypothetical protein